MAPLPYNNTAIFTANYTWSQGAAQMQVRYEQAGGGQAAARLVCEQIAGLLGDDLDQDWVFTGARAQAAGSNFSVPVGAPLDPTASGFDQPETQRPVFISFVGRSALGRRVSITVYGVRLTPDESWRFERGEITNVDAVITWLQTGNPNQGIAPLAIDGTQVVWYPYANVGYNAYYQRRQRR
jgi:hypothetical protein